MAHSAWRAYLLVPRVASGRAGGGHGGEDVRLAERGEPHLPLGVHVGSNLAPKNALSEQDQRGAEGLRVELVPEGDGGQISTVSDEAGVLHIERSLDF